MGKKYVLCNECEEWEILIDACFADDDYHMCDYCFEEKAHAEKDELSLIIIQELIKHKVKKAKHRKRISHNNNN